MIRNTGMVNAGFSRYLMEGLKSGIPPTEAMLIKKNTMLTKSRQKPIEYMSLLSNTTMFFRSPFKKYLGRIADPMKNATNAIIRVMNKLFETLLRDNSRKQANRRSTMRGLKI